VLIGLIAIGVAGASAIALELAYIQRKRGKQAKERSGEIQGHPATNIIHMIQNVFRSSYVDVS
jgi:hypothetical protein